MKPRTRPRGFAAWKPRPETLATVDRIKAVLAEYREHLPLTCRQVFYRLVGTGAWEKTELAYNRLCEVLNRARRARLIPFEAIRDDGIVLRQPPGWDGPGEMLRAFIANAESFRLDRQGRQPKRLLFAVEAAGMVPQVARVAEPFGIPVYSCGGFDSTTAQREMSLLAGRWNSAEVLHIGDHDPSGEALHTALAANVIAFADTKGIRFTRLAVTPARIDALHLPTAAPKATDRRRFEGLTTQAEAIPPETLADIVRQAIEVRLDRNTLDAVLAEEQAIRGRLLAELVPLLRRMEAGA